MEVGPLGTPNAVTDEVPPSSQRFSGGFPLRETTDARGHEKEPARQDTKGTLDDTIDFLKSIAPDCDYISVNFEIRKKNRWAERDGLEKATPWDRAFALDARLECRVSPAPLSASRPARAAVLL